MGAAIFMLHYARIKPLCSNNNACIIGCRWTKLLPYIFEERREIRENGKKVPQTLRMALHGNINAKMYIWIAVLDLTNADANLRAHSRYVGTILERFRDLIWAQDVCWKVPLQSRPDEGTKMALLLDRVYL
jgi:hypothetical protein